jgi:hypothetical protein
MTEQRSRFVRPGPRASASTPIPPFWRIYLWAGARCTTVPNAPGCRRSGSAPCSAPDAHFSRMDRHAEKWGVTSWQLIPLRTPLLARFPTILPRRTMSRAIRAPNSPGVAVNTLAACDTTMWVTAARRRVDEFLIEPFDHWRRYRSHHSWRLENPSSARVAISGKIGERASPVIPRARNPAPSAGRPPPSFVSCSRLDPA